MLYDIMKS